MFGLLGFLIGLLLVAASVIMVFFLQSTAELQTYNFDKHIVLLGLLMFFVGIALVFLP
jgi:hypothetical protein